jgi:hypothetical protein
MASLETAVAALRRRDGAGALAALDGADGPRAHAYRAQALAMTGDLAAADRELTQAIRLARAEGDSDGVAAWRALRQGWLASLAAIDLADRGAAADAALLHADDASLGPDELVRKATALRAAGRPAEAARAASLAVKRASGDRETVLALLALAGCSDDPQPLHDAHRRADASGDQNLVAAVARTARMMGVELERPEFG